MTMAYTKRLPFIVPVLALALAACSGGDVASTPAPLTAKQSERLDKEIGNRIAGKPVNCLSSSPQSNSIRISDNIILYKTGSTVYKSQLDYSCRGLANDDDVMVVETFGGYYCKGDIFQLVDRFGGIPGPICRFGAFVPYRKADGGS
ncbi:MAG: hypothetical protein HC843_08050 [Sphingomonadales bacterium]|nr:hypothetical protein [Sphingomonadales bacterium]